MSKDRLKLMAIVLASFLFAIFSTCINVQLSLAQSNLKSLFPEAFEHPLPELYFNEPIFDKLEFSFSQREAASALSVKYEEERSNFFRHPNDINELLPIKRRVQSELCALLSEKQIELLDQVVVTQYFQRLAAYNASLEKTPIQNDVNSLFLVPAIAKFLELEEWQELEIRDAMKSTNLCCQKSKKTEQKTVNGIFERWQRTLFSELLDFQQRDFRQATGIKIEFPNSLEGIQLKANYGGLQFLQNHKFVSSFTMSPPDPTMMLLQTPFYLDAHMQPHGMFALLLSHELVADLKITPDQYERIRKLKSTWDLEHPLPPELRVELSFGANMSSKKQRAESTAASKAYAAIEDQVFEVLTATQRDRLRQIWNQFVLSMGWSAVPLTFPDWRDYLELSNEQGIAFDRINNEFREEIEKLLEQFKSD